MNNSNKLNSHQTSRLVAYHKLKRKFLNLADIDKEDPNQLMICEFKGQDFQLLIEQFDSSESLHLFTYTEIVGKSLAGLTNPLDKILPSKRSRNLSNSISNVITRNGLIFDCSVLPSEVNL